MNDSPLVSIICTSYNQETFIRDALEGFVMQKTNFPYEIIVHDDASTDRTVEIIKEYELKYPELFFNIYQETNQYSKGYGNVGKIVFAAAKGKYIAMCEGDDYWTDPLKLQKQVDFLENNNEYSLVCHDAIVINNITNTTKLFFSSYHKKQICTTKDALNVQFCPTASILFRKRSILLLGNLNIGAQAGDQMLVQLISLDGMLYRMYEVMSAYRKHDKGISEFFKKDQVKNLNNRIDGLIYFNEISNYKFNKNIKIEILLIKNRINLLKSKSKHKAQLLKLYRRLLSRRRNYLIQKQ